MIIDAVISVIVAMLAPVFSLLPAGSISVLNPAAGWAVTLGSKLGWADWWIPMTEVIDMLRIMFLAFAGLAVYKLANWTYRHIPQLWGFGPGSG